MISSILEAARELLGPKEDEANVHPEYLRAVVEMTAHLLSVATDGLYHPDHEDVLELIRTP
jgi:hypothetical protein